MATMQAVAKTTPGPGMQLVTTPIPTPGPEEVLIEIKACGICGSDVHMAQADAEGYIYYPGLTGFPSILGHEFSGVVVAAGKQAFDKRTNKPFKGGEAVTSDTPWRRSWRDGCAARPGVRLPTLSAARRARGGLSQREQFALGSRPSRESAGVSRHTPQSRSCGETDH